MATETELAGVRERLFGLIAEERTWPSTSRVPIRRSLKACSV